VNLFGAQSSTNINLPKATPASSEESKLLQKVEIRAGASFGETHFAVGMILWVVFKNSLGRDRFKSIIVTTFQLKQLSLPSSRAQVTWGGAEKEATA